MGTTSRAQFLGFAAASLALGVPRIARGDAPLRLRVAATANDTFAEAYYAQEEGFFRRAGLDVDLMTFPNGGAVAAAVVGNAVDVGITNSITLATAVTHGVPLQFFASGGMYNPAATSLAVAKNAPYREAKDLEGTAIATGALKDTNALALHAWLDQNGADFTKIRLVEIPYSAMGEAIARRTVAAAIIPEPYLTFAREKEQIRDFASIYDVFGKDFIIGAWFSTSSWLKENQTAARRFADAIYATGRWASAHKDQTLEILARYAKLDVAAVRHMARSPYGTALTPAMVEGILGYAYRYKMLDKPVSASEIIAKV
jgi:NitT/TauT family transport system substrate-binding protein